MSAKFYLKLRCGWLIFMTGLMLLSLSSCSRRLGWGILLWTSEEPAIPSGTVLPVYIRSNIDKVWVVGIPDGFRTQGGLNKFEVPLAQFEF
jgi:hypothetical protein